MAGVLVCAALEAYREEREPDHFAFQIESIEMRIEA